MKQISARQFRTSFPDLTEPVTVLRRNDNANFDVLGVWTPGIPAIDAVNVGGAPDTSPFAQSYNPAPKPSQKGKK